MPLFSPTLPGKYVYLDDILSPLEYIKRTVLHVKHTVIVDL